MSDCMICYAFCVKTDMQYLFCIRRNTAAAQYFPASKANRCDHASGLFARGVKPRGQTASAQECKERAVAINRRQAPGAG